jgi:hypothetical protein
MAVASIGAAFDEADSVTVLLRQDAEAAVLDFVNPARSRRLVLDRPRQTGLLYRSSIRPRKKPLGLVNFDAKLAVSTAGQRWGGRLLVMLWAAHKGSLRSAPH